MEAHFSTYFDHHFTELPILLITYVFAVSIAIDLDLRSQFYTHYQGKVPAFFQFCLNSIRIGCLNDLTIYALELDMVYNDMIEIVGYPYILMFEDMKKSENLPIILAWFFLLERYFSSNNLYFSNLVDLERVPLVSNGSLTLTGINGTNAKFLTSSVVENSDLKEKYKLLTKCLNAQILKDEYPSKREALEAHKIDPVEICQEDEAEKKLASSLIAFVMHCSVDDLPKQKSDSGVAQHES